MFGAYSLWATVSSVAHVGFVIVWPVFKAARRRRRFCSMFHILNSDYVSKTTLLDHYFAVRDCWLGIQTDSDWMPFTLSRLVGLTIPIPHVLVATFHLEEVIAFGQRPCECGPNFWSAKNRRSVAGIHEHSFETKLHLFFGDFRWKDVAHADGSGTVFIWCLKRFYWHDHLMSSGLLWGICDAIDVGMISIGLVVHRKCGDSSSLSAGGLPPSRSDACPFAKAAPARASRKPPANSKPMTPRRRRVASRKRRELAALHHARRCPAGARVCAQHHPQPATASAPAAAGLRHSRAPSHRNPRPAHRPPPAASSCSTRVTSASTSTPTLS